MNMQFICTFIYVSIKKHIRFYGIYKKSIVLFIIVHYFTQYMTGIIFQYIDISYILLASGEKNHSGSIENNQF